jgi:hypothetical protein
MIILIKKFLNASLKGHIDYVDPAQTELNQLLKIILNQKLLQKL